MKKLCVGILAVALLSGCAPKYSEGERTGVITKISRKGLIMKSWEGTINQGGTKTLEEGNGNVSVVPNAEDFNVQDPKVVEQLQKAAKEGYRVTIKYQQWFIEPPSIENSRVVTAVEVEK